MSLFEPSVSHAREYRAAMDEALWSSVRNLLSGDDSRLQNAAAPGPADFLDYAAYFDLALVPPALDEVPSEARASALQRLKSRLEKCATGEPPNQPPRIANFSEEYFDAGTLQQMDRWWDVDPDMSLDMTPATEPQCEAARVNIGKALEMLRNVAPELHGEFEAVIGDIVLSRPDRASRGTYSGASSLALWGALTINPEAMSTWLQMYRHLVHEEGHNILFAIAGDKALVADNPEDRHMSPIRPDPRPTDGIFHAAFVSAREALALDLLLERHEAEACLTDTEQETVEAMLKSSVLAFVDCAELLHNAARLTDFGKTVLADCEAYMADSFMVD